MPYLTSERKKELLAGAAIHAPGDLNYLVTLATLAYLNDEDSVSARAEWNVKVDSCIDDYLLRHGSNYSVFNAIIGALVCCSLEWQRRHFGSTNSGVLVSSAIIDAKVRQFYREVIAPYEDEKILQNGDVYPCD